MTKMGAALGKEVAKYKELLQRGKKYMETKLFDGEYFNQQKESIQRVRMWTLVCAGDVELWPFAGTYRHQI